MSTEDPNKKEDEINEGSSAFDDLASGDMSPVDDQPVSNETKNIDQEDETAQTASANEEQTNVQQSNEQEADEANKNEESQNFADNFENNYAVGDEDVGTFDESIDETGFESFDENSDFMDDEFNDPTFDDAIDAEFTDFDEDEELSAFDEDENMGAQTSSASTKTGLLNNKMFMYGGIAVAALAVIGLGATMLMPASPNKTQGLNQSNSLAGQQNQQTASTPKQEDTQTQSLSSILNSGNLADENRQGLLDDLDKLDQALTPQEVKPANQPKADSLALPVFEERQSLGALPMPTPIGNEDINDTAEPVEQLTDDNVLSRQPNPFQPAAKMNDGGAQLSDIEQNNSGSESPTPIFGNNTKSVDGNVVGNSEIISLMQDLRGNLQRFEAQTNIVMQRIDGIEKKIDGLPNEEELASLNDKLSALEKRVSSSGVRSVSAPKQTAKSSDSKPKVKKQVTAASTPKKKVPWELRAATPQQAWVGKKGEGALRQVSVGDSLDGVGRITSISLNGSKWVIKGTQGTIKQ